MLFPSTVKQIISPSQSQEIQEILSLFRSESMAPTKRPNEHTPSPSSGSDDEKDQASDGGGSPKSPPSRKPPYRALKARASQSLFGGSWSQEDEIVILKAVQEYKAENGGADPFPAIESFHDSIKASLDKVASDRQLSNKIRKLRDKYSKKRKNPDSLNAHDRACYHLVQEIWSPESTRSKKSKIVPQEKEAGEEEEEAEEEEKEAEDEDEEAEEEEEKAEDEEIDDEDFPCFVESLKRGKSLELPEFCKGFLLGRMRQIGRDKLSEIEKKLRSLHHEEMRLWIKNARVVQEQVKLAMELLEEEEEDD